MAPLEAVIAALERLRQARDDIKGQIYELTGISDVVRGTTKASETLGAQNLKAKFAGVRIQKLQDEVARFAQDILRIKAELICKHFLPEQIVKLSNAKYYPDFQNQQLLQEALALIKGEHEEFEWRVNVQADSLALADYTSMKNEKVEFTNAVATFLQSAATTMKAVPDTAPIIFSSLKFAISGFKGSQELEGVIDQTLDVIMQKIQNPPPPQPDPQMMKLQGEMKMKGQEHQMKMQEMGQEQQFKQQDHAMNMQAKQLELAIDAQSMGDTLRFQQQEHAQGMVAQQQNHQQQAEHDNLKFITTLAQDEAKARAQMVKDSRKDANKGD